MTTSPSHPFISYARSGEGLRWAEMIDARLRDQGIRCWRDVQSVAPGENFVEGLSQGLAQADLLLLVVCDAVAERDWVTNELLTARERGLRIVPLRVESTAPLPLQVKSLQAIDFTQNEAAAWQQLFALFSSQPSSVRLDRTPTRDEELAYLQQLLQNKKAQTALAWYTTLSGEQCESRYPLDFDEAFIPITLRMRRRDHDKTLHENAQAGERVSDACEAIAHCNRLAVLGEPGAGKTYTLWHLAAEAAQRALNHTSQPLPVLLPLGNWIGDEPLEAFIDAQLGPLAGATQQLLDSGRLMLLLDGLNELPTGQRGDKAEQVWAVAQALHHPTVVVSCREKDFSGELRLELDTLTLEPLDPLQVHHFIHQSLNRKGSEAGRAESEELFWHLAGGVLVQSVWRQWQRAGLTLEQFWLSETVPQYQPNWWERLFWRRVKAHRMGREGISWPWFEDVRLLARSDQRTLLRLASSPYLLRMMVLLHGRHGLASFQSNRAQLFGAFVADLLEREGEGHRQREGAAHPGREGLVTALGHLAWQLQAEAGGADSVQLALPLSEAQAHLGAHGLTLARDAGLIELGDTVRFSHQLLQEYFTALGMRQRLLAGTLRDHPPWDSERWWARSGWEEATVLMAGLEPDNPLPWFDWLADAHPGLLLDCLERSGCRAPSVDELASLKLAKRWQPRLDADSEHWETAPEGRQPIALAMGGLDVRSGVGLRPDGVPDIDWVEIAEGEFLYGEKREPMTLSGFHLARYPVTNAQFQAFIDAGGYAEACWWQGLAEHPQYSAEPRWSEPNRPRETVSWFEAVAFCRWLSEQLGYEVRLPTEQEWERAARGTGGREYPWGDDYSSGYANIDETWGETGEHDLNATSVVGLYPQGASPEGVFDLAGNVWEWCLNEYEQPERTALSGTQSRVLRGGSWHDFAGGARAANRDWDDPVSRNYDVGFRVLCVSPIHSDR